KLLRCPFNTLQFLYFKNYSIVLIAGFANGVVTKLFKRRFS
ncbi:MAG: hypothetical protein ACI9RO_001832, partial [Alteromonas macleodii]